MRLTLSRSDKLQALARQAPRPSAALCVKRGHSTQVPRQAVKTVFTLFTLFTRLARLTLTIHDLTLPPN